MAKASTGSAKTISLALQGGGSHGAFSWGVLDRLLQEPSLEIEAISGTSAGAMNAAVLAHGLVTGDRDATRQALHDFWLSIAKAGDAAFNPYRFARNWFNTWGWNIDTSLVATWINMLSLVWSPYDNPFYENPLADLLDAAIDFDHLRAAVKPRLFICATNVKTNVRKVFHTEELSLNALLASACIPSTFRAVEVDGEFYWDGGYMGNPVLSPLLRFSQDILIVEVNPRQRGKVPMRAADILVRLNEITFNASLIHEINIINTVTRLIEAGYLTHPYYKPIRFHHIEADRAIGSLGVGSKNNTEWGFLLYLRDLGRRSADAWLNDPGQFGKIGVKSSVEMERFLKPLF